MTLIQLVNQALFVNCRYLAVDEDGDTHGYLDKPYIDSSWWGTNQESNIVYLGKYKLTCNWKDSRINLTKLTLQGNLK